MFSFISTALAATAETPAEESLLHSAEFWLGIAFAIFIVAIAKPVSKAVSGALDKRADEIAKNIDEAQKQHASMDQMLHQLDTGDGIKTHVVPV